MEWLEKEFQPEKIYNLAFDDYSLSFLLLPIKQFSY